MKIFSTKKKISFGSLPMQVSKSKFDSLGLKTFVYDFFKTKDFLWVKTPMGIKSLVNKKGEGKDKWSQMYMNFSENRNSK